MIYAAGTGKVLGVDEVTSDWYEGGKNERRPYRMDTEIQKAVPVAEGIALDTLSEERAIGKSIRQTSQARLSEAEAAQALEAFGLATN